MRTGFLGWALALQVLGTPTCLSAAPVTVQFEGVLAIGDVGTAAGPLASRLSPASFGAYSATLTDDGSAWLFSQDIYLATGVGSVLVGRSYDVAGSITVTLADGTTLSASGLQGTVWNGFAPWGAGASLGATFPIPASMWIGPPPTDCGATSSGLCWLPAMSSLGFRTSGNLVEGDGPPLDLGSVAAGSLSGTIFGDFNHDGLVAIAAETISLEGSAQRVGEVSEPSGFALLALALPMLARRLRPARSVPVAT